MDKLKIAIGAGHNIYLNGNFDVGAVGNGTNEAKEVKETVRLLLPMLENIGIDAHDITPYNGRFRNATEQLNNRRYKVLQLNPDLYIDIHLNAFHNVGANGSEIFIWSTESASHPYAQSILKNIISELGTTNRGVKTNQTFSTLRVPGIPSMIVEGCFITNVNDMSEFTPQKYANAIFNGIKERLPNGYIEKYAPKKEANISNNNNNTLYRVQVGAFSQYANAEALLKDLKIAGFTGFIRSDADLPNTPVEVPDEIPTPEETVKKPLSKYYENDDLKIIETEPENLYVSFLGNTLRGFGVYGINGTWQNNAESHLKRSIWGILANQWGQIGENSHQNSPDQSIRRGTFVVYSDNTMGVEVVNNIKQISKPYNLAIGGGSLTPIYNPIGEKIPSDILRVTHHTAIGYKNNRAYLIITKRHCWMSEFKTMVEKLNLDGSVFLDGGGSTQMFYPPNSGLHTTRRLASGVFLKQV